jgi:hypothetical protein
MDDVLRGKFYAFVGALHLEQDARAGPLLREMWKFGMSGDLYVKIAGAANAFYLQPREREITTHGIKRTFRFWSVEEKHAYLRFCNEVIGLLRAAAGERVCVGYGGALALGRSNDLIPHDDDIDVLVALPAERFGRFAAARDHVAAGLDGHELRISNAAPNILAVHSPRLRFTLDVFVAFDEDGYFSSFPGPRRQIPMAHVFPAAAAELFGERVPVPADLEKYLAAVYGKDWRTPKPYFFHKEDRTPFSDLL